MSFYEVDHHPVRSAHSDALSPRATRVIGVLVLSVTVLSVVLALAVAITAPAVRFTVG